MVADRSCGDFEGVSIDTGENRQDFFAGSRLCEIALLNFGVRDYSLVMRREWDHKVVLPRIHTMSSPDSDAQDLTPISASPTDVAPLGNPSPKPLHERTAAEEAGGMDWAAIEADPGFAALLRSKASFVVPATAFFMIYYFLLPIGVGWFPKLMETPVWGALNVAYLFALSQFLMAWILAFLYVGVAAGWDRDAARLIAKFRTG